MQLRIPHRTSPYRPAEFYISLTADTCRPKARKRVLLRNRSRNRAIEVTLGISQGTDQSWGKIQLNPGEHRLLRCTIVGGGPMTPIIVYRYNVLGASYVIG